MLQGVFSAGHSRAVFGAMKSYSRKMQRTEGIWEKAHLSFSSCSTVEVTLAVVIHGWWP